MGTWVEDGSLVIGNMLAAAHSLGVGSCWIHRARQEFELPEGKALMQKWGVDARYAGVGHCILGYAAAEPAPAKARKGRFHRPRLRLTRRKKQVYTEENTQEGHL